MLRETSAQDIRYNEAALHPTQKVACANCSRLIDAGDRVCQHCGAVFFSLQTTKFDSAVVTRFERTRRVGSAILNERKPITFEIGPEQLVLPITDSVIVGRVTPAPVEQPDIDLEPFLGHQHGISRLHLKITRSHDLIYVTDLKSMNGTRLNGTRLLPYEERILRSGDELLIGHLRVRVSF